MAQGDAVPFSFGEGEPPCAYGKDHVPVFSLGTNKMKMIGDVVRRLALSNGAKREMILTRDGTRQLTPSNDVKRKITLRSEAMS